MEDDTLGGTGWNQQWLQWYQRFLQQRQATFAQQIQTLHAQQPWNQPQNTRFQNPLVGADAPLAGDRLTDTAPAMMGYFMQQPGADGGGGSMMNPMLEEMILTGSGGL